MLRSNTTTALLTLSLVLAPALAGCGGPEPRMMVAAKNDDGVPANSASEQRLAGTKPSTSPAPAEDPSQPLTVPLNTDNAAAGGAGAGAGSGSGGGATAGAGKGGGSGKGGGKNPKNPPPPAEKEPKSTGSKVTKAECKQLFDKYIDLSIGSDSRFEGIPPEMIAQLKEQALSQAQSQKGDPCSTQEVSRAQYTCAVSAPTTSAWQRCMK